MRLAIRLLSDKDTFSKAEEKENNPDTASKPESNAVISGRSFDFPSAGNFSYEEDATGISYEKLFGKYFDGAALIEIQDPYIMKPYQTRNLMEFIETVYSHKKPEEEVKIKLLTKLDRDFTDDQKMRLSRLQEGAALLCFDFDFSFDGTDTIHDRTITLDNGWNIILGRGLDTLILTCFPLRPGYKR